MCRIYTDIEIERFSKIPILNVAEFLGMRVNNNNRTCCFMHDDAHPSMSFNVNENYYNCFVCNTGGSVIKLVEKFNKLDFPHACDWLEKNFVIEIREGEANAEVNHIAAPNRPEIVNITINAPEFEIQPDTEVYTWIYDNTILDFSAEQYLIQRGFNKETISRFKSVNVINEFFDLCRRRWGLERMKKCGLMCGKDYNQFIWGWGYVILIPFYDEDNSIVYIQARNILNADMRYINLKGIELPMYNQQILRDMNAGDTLYICEGVMDAIAATQCHKKAIGIIGANGFKESFVHKLLNFNIVIVPHNDDAGNSFYESVRTHFSNHNIDVNRLGIPPQHNDLNDFLNR
jgi:DNA primase